jgi:hypothetical protein
MKCCDCIYAKMCEFRYEREYCGSFEDKSNFAKVVRCKDCYYFYAKPHLETIGRCMINDGKGQYTRSCNGYCSDGKRREQ